MNRPATSWLPALFTLFVAFASGLETSTAEDQVYEVGVAKIDITPDYPIRLNGFGFRREESGGVTQRIWAKALAIGSDDQGPAILITLDSLGIRLPMVEEVARRLNRNAGIFRDRVAVTFSHSHTAPKVNGASDNIFSQPISDSHQQHIDRYTRELTDKLEVVALEALAVRRQARLFWSVGEVKFAKNRRTPGGPVDHDLPVLVVKDLDDAVRAIYVSYACHCVTLSHNKISGDWAGYAQQAIEDRNPGAIALVSIGAGSDSNPDSGVVGDRVDVATNQGEKIAKEVQLLLGGPLRPIEGPLLSRLRLIELPLEPLPSREQLQQLADKGGPAGYNAQTQLARLDAEEELITSINYPIQTWNFGDALTMVFLAGEVCVDYSLRLKRELDHRRLWINAYSNDFCSYIPSERLAREGGYGGGAEIPYFALPTKLRRGLEQRIVDEVRRQVPISLAVQPNNLVTPAFVQDIAESLIDEQQDRSMREQKIADHPWVAADIVAALSGDLTSDREEEYRRIPWIWRVSIAAGRRSDSEQLQRLLHVALPKPGMNLSDWQAVVIGGGVINGISLGGSWPSERIEELLRDDAQLALRWRQALDQAAVMAENERVATGTRYDALRMIAMDRWDRRGAQLTKYLADGVNDELQMGAISGVADMQEPQAAAALIAGIGHYSNRNRSLAIDGLLRSGSRITVLLDALENATVNPQHFTQQQRDQLLHHEDNSISRRAKSLFTNE